MRCWCPRNFTYRCSQCTITNMLERPSIFQLYLLGAIPLPEGFCSVETIRRGPRRALRRRLLPPRQAECPLVQRGGLLPGEAALGGGLQAGLERGGRRPTGCRHRSSSRRPRPTGGARRRHRWPRASSGRWQHGRCGPAAESAGRAVRRAARAGGAGVPRPSPPSRLPTLCQRARPNRAGERPPWTRGSAGIALDRMEGAGPRLLARRGGLRWSPQRQGEGAEPARSRRLMSTINRGLGCSLDCIQVETGTLRSPLFRVEAAVAGRKHRQADVDAHPGQRLLPRPKPPRYEP